MSAILILAQVAGSYKNYWANLTMPLANQDVCLTNTRFQRCQANEVHVCYTNDFFLLCIVDMQRNIINNTTSLTFLAE